jgi:hypothetical protein
MNRSTPATRFHLVAARANLDRIDEAETEARTGLVLDRASPFADSEIRPKATIRFS